MRRRLRRFVYAGAGRAVTLLPTVVAAKNAFALLGGMLLCGETRGLEERHGMRRATEERAAIVATVLNRVRQRRSTPEREILRRGQYVPSVACGVPQLRRLNALFWTYYRNPGQIPTWARKAYAFATPKAARFVRKQWIAGGFVEVPQAVSETAHVFFTKP